MARRRPRPLGIISDILYEWPGRKRFGLYSYLPLFFVIGAGLEFTMIKWTVGETNFYRTFKKRRVDDISRQELAEEGVELLI